MDGEINIVKMNMSPRILLLLLKILILIYCLIICKVITLTRIFTWNFHVKQKRWVTVEKSMGGCNLAYAVWILLQARGLSDGRSPLAAHTLKIWNRVNAKGNYAPQTSLRAILWGFPWFPLGRIPVFFPNPGPRMKRHVVVNLSEIGSYISCQIHRISMVGSH